MLGKRSLVEMSEDEVLDAAGLCAETARRAEVDLLRVAYQWAVLHSADRLDPAQAGLPGREKAMRWGGPGTDQVTEFAAAQLGVRIGRSPYAARQLIADAQDLVHRHPQLWARVEAGEVRASYARHVVKATRDLEPVEAAYVDAGVVESADGRIPWSRFEALVEAKVAQAAPATAREKEERARTATFAKRIRGEANGMASFLVRADAATITAIDAAVTQQATELATLQDQRPGTSGTRTWPPTTSAASAPSSSSPGQRVPTPTSRTCSRTSSCSSTPTPAPTASLTVRTSSGSRAMAPSPRPGSVTSSAPAPGSPSSRSSTSPDRHPWTPGRSRIDIVRPCI